MDELEVSHIVGRVSALVESRYLDPDVGASISRVLAEGLAQRRYPPEARALAAALTGDLQSVNGDKHLRLLFREETLAERAPGDDSDEVAAVARWAAQTCSGVACVERLAGNVGYLNLEPILFPAAMCGQVVAFAISLLADTEALIVDLRRCIGGEPAMSALITSYLWDHEPAQLTGLRERGDHLPKQSWTLPFVPGRRFGKVKPAYVLTSGATFSGGEQLSYDLQQLGRAAIVGERTGGGAHAREGFPVHPHLEATIPVADAVNPKTGTNWEGTGVVPDVPATADEARDIAYGLALEAVIATAGSTRFEAEGALAALRRARGGGGRSDGSNGGGA